MVCEPGKFGVFYRLTNNKNTADAGAEDGLRLDSDTPAKTKRPLGESDLFRSRKGQLISWRTGKHDELP